VAVLFGAVQIGGQSIQTMGVSSSVSTILQALILFGAIAAGVLSRYRVEMVAADGPASGPVDGVADGAEEAS